MNEWKWWMKSLRECVSSKCTAGKSHLESLWRKYAGQSCFVFVLWTWQNCRVSCCISAVLTMVRWQLALWKDTAAPVLLRKLLRYSSSFSFETVAEIQQLLFFWENCRDTAAPVLLRKLQIYSSSCSTEKIAKIQQLLFCWKKLLVSPSLKAFAALHYSWQQCSLTINTRTRRLAWRQQGRVAQTPSSGLRGFMFEPQFRLTFFPLRLVVVWLVQWHRLPCDADFPLSLLLVCLVQWRRLPPQPIVSVPGAVTQTSPSDFPLNLVLMWLVQWCGQPGSQHEGHVPLSYWLAAVECCSDENLHNILQVFWVMQPFLVALCRGNDPSLAQGGISTRTIF